MSTRDGCRPGPPSIQAPCKGLRPDLLVRTTLLSCWYNTALEVIADFDLNGFHLLNGISIFMIGIWNIHLADIIFIYIVLFLLLFWPFFVIIIVFSNISTYYLQSRLILLLHVNHVFKKMVKLPKSNIGKIYILKLHYAETCSRIEDNFKGSRDLGEYLQQGQRYSPRSRLEDTFKEKSYLRLNDDRLSGLLSMFPLAGFVERFILRCIQTTLDLVLCLVNHNFCVNTHLIRFTSIHLLPPHTFQKHELPTEFGL